MGVVALGSTGLSHAHTAAIDVAAASAAGEPVVPRPIVPSLQRRFGLTAAEACAAIRDSVAMRGGRDG